MLEEEESPRRNYSPFLSPAEVWGRGSYLAKVRNLIRDRASRQTSCPDSEIRIGLFFFFFHSLFIKILAIVVEKPCGNRY